MKIGIVIPYFQRKPGLLRAALRSIAEQSVVREREYRLQIALVDDASPLPASEELAGFKLPECIDLRLHCQPNAGAGAARNKALGLLDADCDFIAFLDSDDVWTPNHLARALTALRAGANFYFCDAVRREDESSENAEAPPWFIAALRPVAAEEGLFLYDGSSDLAIVKGMVPTTSTIVHRRRERVVTRFPSGYFRFGEDQCYCLRYLAAEGKIAYSSAIEVFCGRGVNIFAGNTPGSESARLCLVDEIAYRRDVLASLALSAPAEQHVRSKLAAARQAILWQGLWFAKDGRPDWLIRSLRAQPWLCLQLPSAIWSLVRIRSAGNAPAKQRAGE